LLNVTYCKTSAGASSQARLIDLGARIHERHTMSFKQMKLPVSGYLAGWMFYIADPFDLNRCPSSYARIMSERSPGLYHIAIHNDLSSYYELDTGLRFNFQQFSNGRVRKDDFIALGSSKTPEKLNCTNVVSVSRNADNTYGEAAIKAYISG